MLCIRTALWTLGVMGAFSRPAVAGERETTRIEWHLHGPATLRGAKLLNLAKRTGTLEVGLAAIGVRESTGSAALKAGRRLLDLSQPNHSNTYRLLRTFRQTAFARENYPVWVRAAAAQMRSQAHETFAQFPTQEAGRFVETAKAHGISLDGIRILLNAARDRVPDREQAAKLLRTHPEIVGLDVLGRETGSQEPKALNDALDVLLGSGRRDTVLRIHAGEGFLGEGGRDNVNLALTTLEERSRTTDLSSVTIVMAHVARISDVKAASRDLRTLRARGVRVVVNVNPVSNLLYGGVKNVADIAALRLPAENLAAGSDNVGSLARNAKIVDLLQSGSTDAARKRASRYERLRDRWRVHEASRAP